jgi:hypothetical protein
MRDTHDTHVEHLLWLLLLHCMVTGRHVHWRRRVQGGRVAEACVPRWRGRRHRTERGSGGGRLVAIEDCNEMRRVLYVCPVDPGKNTAQMGNNPECVSTPCLVVPQ